LLAELGASIMHTRLVSWEVEYGDGTGELCTADFEDDEEDLDFIPLDLDR
jgi:hypothetical protein